MVCFQNNTSRYHANFSVVLTGRVIRDPVQSPFPQTLRQGVEPFKPPSEAGDTQLHPLSRFDSSLVLQGHLHRRFLELALREN
jgi:hypothetical protein